MSDNGENDNDGEFQHEIAAIFAPDGRLAQALPAFMPRQQQTEMAVHIAGTLKNQGVLVAEAGTGTGKTFAYLVPVLCYGGKVIISTGTKNLQDQLFNRDLPLVRQALALPVSIALLKGRANYVCPFHLKRNVENGMLPNAQVATDLQKIARFAKESHSGDKSECSRVSEDAQAWHYATSTRENCLGQDCPEVGACFVMRARRDAMDADIVVVNHHLFFADVVLRDEGLGELLPSSHAVVFDEAHQLPEIASIFFGISFSSAQLIELARDTRTQTMLHARDALGLLASAAALEKAARDFRLQFPVEPQRLAMARAEQNQGYRSALQKLHESLVHLDAELGGHEQRDEQLAACRRRGQDLLEKLIRWSRNEDKSMVRWIETFSHSVILHMTPLQIGDLFRQQMQSECKAWIFTSATLAVGNDCSHYCEQMGVSSLMPPPQTKVWGSPFDYQKQALLYVPQGMPDPNSFEFSDLVVDKALPLINAAGGRTFLLCTSLRAMKRIHSRLKTLMEMSAQNYLLLLQGESPRSELLDRFRLAGNAVLVASQSFWEGVDVPGDALSLVVIDKLPFASPDDPVLSARIDYMRSTGQNPFFDYQLPHAVINIKQGAGRLIRTEHDQGVLCLCDPRIVDRPYGRFVWRSLPPMRRSRHEAEAVDFLQQL